MVQSEQTQSPQNVSWIQNEISLGSSLSDAVQSNRRADFGYLLAMLSTNPMESGFARLQRDPQPDSAWQPPFALGVTAPLGATSRDWQRSPAHYIGQSFTAWRLLNALQPEALHSTNDAHAIPPEVRNNCPGYVRARWSESAASTTEGSEADLVDIIQQARYGTSSV